MSGNADFIVMVDDGSRVDNRQIADRRFGSDNCSRHDHYTAAEARTRRQQRRGMYNVW